MSYVIPICTERINRAKYEKTIGEMTSIAQASIDYYDSHYPKVWPVNISQLAPHSVGMPNYLNYAVTSSAWGVPYALSFQNNLVLVSTTIPSGIAQKNPEGPMLSVVTVSGGDQISISQSVPNEGIGRLQYEKKYLYNQ